MLNSIKKQFLTNSKSPNSGLDNRNISNMLTQQRDNKLKGSKTAEAEVHARQLVTKLLTINDDPHHNLIHTHPPHRPAI